MARKEKPLSVARRLVKSTKLSALLRDAYASLWTDAQCEAAGRNVKSNELLTRANKWLTQADKSLRAGEDVAWSRHRLAWIAELIVALEDARAGVVASEVVAARKARDAQLELAKELKLRVTRRLALLVGGNETRGAALKIAQGEEMQRSLRALATLLRDWRGEARLRLLAEECGLDDGTLEQLEDCAQALSEASGHVVRGAQPSEQQLAGRLLRELDAHHR